MSAVGASSKKSHCIVAYKADDVLAATRKRIALVFRRFNRIVVSVSSGKDSTCLWHLCMNEAEKTGRKIEVFFLDQEAEYISTVEMINRMMRHPLAIPRWYQVPILMTNATSHREVFLEAWFPGRDWMREKSPLAIGEISGEYPMRFYDFFPWLEAQASEPTAHLVGLRSKESFNRFRAVTKNPSFEGLGWSTKTLREGSHKFYPIYDWTFGDVWKYIDDQHLPYNRVYDWMYARSGQDMSKMRISNLIHEKSFRALASLQEFEPDTYDRLVKRLGGVHAAALYCEEPIFNARVLPSRFTTWHEYREHLITSTPMERMAKFARRMRAQGDDEATCREHVRQLLINDWENNAPVKRMKASSLRRIWWDRL